MTQSAINQQSSERNIPSIQLFQTRHEYCRVLKELIDMQYQLISDGAYEELIQLLSKKQTLIDALLRTSRTDPPLNEWWQQQKGNLNEQTRNQCEVMLQETEQFLELLLSSEQECANKLQSQQRDTKAQLEVVSSGIAVQDAYNSNETESQFNFES